MSLYPPQNTSNRHWLPLVVWMVVIFLFSTDAFSSDRTSGLIHRILTFLFPFMSISQLHFWHGVIRKAGHITEYSILALFAWRALAVHPWAAFKPKVFAAAFVLVFALTDELHQMFVASRTSSLMDVGYDFMGGLIMLMFLPKSRNESGTVHSHSVL
jgi:VanZ family protein